MSKMDWTISSATSDKLDGGNNFIIYKFNAFILQKGVIESWSPQMHHMRIVVVVYARVLSSPHVETITDI
jgi:hypothetical protein